MEAAVGGNVTQAQPYGVQEDHLALELIAERLRSAHLEEQLHEALADLSELSARTESVERLKMDILRLASHELRSPLTILHGYLSLVAGGFYGEIPEPLAGVLGILQRRTEEMNALVNDMLVAARVEDGFSRSGAEVSDLRDVVREAVHGLSPRAATKHGLHVRLSDGPVLVRIEPERIVLALRNLVDNAVKYSPHGGDVECALWQDGSTARVRVTDHGLGIAPEDHDKLFTRFGRVVTAANSHIPGIGLGLYFTREAVRSHGGEVVLVDSNGQGSVFELTLPVAE